MAFATYFCRDSLAGEICAPPTGAEFDLSLTQGSPATSQRSTDNPVGPLGELVWAFDQIVGVTLQDGVYSCSIDVASLDTSRTAVHMVVSLLDGSCTAVASEASSQESTAGIKTFTTGVLTWGTATIVRFEIWLSKSGGADAVKTATLNLNDADSWITVPDEFITSTTKTSRAYIIG